MNTLIYKRTHRGDPNKTGVFGVSDCMGRIRDWDFNAVIGIGGKRPWRNHAEIANKINWIGINASKTNPSDHRWNGPLVSFDRFALYDEKGPPLKKLAPRLYNYMFEDKRVRAVLSRSLPDKMQQEIAKILKLAQNQRSRSPVRSGLSLKKK